MLEKETPKVLQILFNDDEHTAADGPYSRVMRTRKWLYLTSAASLAVSGGLYHPAAANALVKVVSLPTQVVAPTLALGVGYLLLQFCILVRQLVSTYDIVLSERFKSRREEELGRARDNVRQAQAEHRASVEKFRREPERALAKRIAELEAEHKERQSELGTATNVRSAAERSGVAGQRLAALWHQENRAKTMTATARSAIRRLQRDALGQLDPAYDEGVALAVEGLDGAQEALQALRRQEPSERRGYRTSELCIDALRIGPPMIAAALALLHFLAKALGS